MNENVRESTEWRSPAVSLVGAGPGDPKLLTLRGAELLRQADVVVYDYLANARLLQHCQPRAELIYVGKKAASHTMSQAQINDLLIERANAGQRVVRLKGGDPFVFGRGGEEAEALRDAGISFEIVPGITAAIAAPAYAGIPVTHRDLNSSFTFITGHEKEAEYRDDETRTRDVAAGSSNIDWNTIAKLPAIAFYMGAKSLPRICEKLIAHGMQADLPAATIQWGTHPMQRTVVGTVKTIAEVVSAAGIGAPAITIIGRVVAMREKLNWFESRPLFGQTILVTRTREQASELSERLEALGANVLEAPTIEIVPRDDWGIVDEALHQLIAGAFDWVTFTSVNGVIATRRRMRELKLDGRIFAKSRVAAIGAATAAAIDRELCLNVDLCPDKFTAESLADAFAEAGAMAKKRHLVLKADIGRPVLVERMRAGGAAVVGDIAIYETKVAERLPQPVIEAIEERAITWAAFTSASTARNLASLLGSHYRDRLAGMKLASIGPVTSTEIKTLGLSPTVEADPHDISGLVDAIVRSASAIEISR